MSPPPVYYGLRRFCPYLGVIQVVDVGEACAFSTDGRSWRIRTRTATGRFRWGGAVVESGSGVQVQGDATRILVEALRSRPELPFPLEDRYELWLLRKDSLQPLALLKTCLQPDDLGDSIDPAWAPFLREDDNFVSPTLECGNETRPPRLGRLSHKDQLERIVHEASRPLPVAQWFHRHRDGSGLGLQGLRVEEVLRDRELPREAFPELLVAEDWERERYRLVVQDFHDWIAGRLLAHQSLKLATRARLERAACRRPETVLENHVMYPEVVDPQALEVALVSARLMQGVR